METRGYPVRVYQEADGSWAAEVPDLPGCVAGADDPVELFELLSDAIDEWVLSAEMDGVAVPQPSRKAHYSGRFLVRTLPSLHEQLAWRADQEGVSLNSLVLVALTSYLAAPEFHPVFSPPYRMPSAHDWEFENAFERRIVRYYSYGGGATLETEPRLLAAGNQIEVTQSDTPALLQ